MWQGGCFPLVHKVWNGGQGGRTKDRSTTLTADPAVSGRIHVKEAAPPGADEALQLFFSTRLGEGHSKFKPATSYLTITWLPLAPVVWGF